MNRFYGTDFLKQMLDDMGALGQPVIRPVRTLDELQQVYRLTHSCYAENGYFNAHPSGMLVHYPQFDHIEETSILIAIMDGKIVGSVSLTIDGPSGFSIEDDFKSDVDAVRAEGKPVCVVWRLVVDKDAREGRSVVMHLINAVIDLGLKKGQITTLFSVNPKHERVYRRMLNMDIVGRKETTEGLENAPAVLLRGNVPQIGEIKESGEVKSTISTAPLFYLLASSPY